MPCMACMDCMAAGLLVLDTTIVHPSDADILAEAAQLDGTAVQVRAAQIMHAHEKVVKNGVYGFEALAHEAYGGMAEGARRHLKRFKRLG